MNHVGKMYPSIVPYFNARTKKTEFKSRPILILAEPIGVDTEYTVLPVSTVSNHAFYNALFDVEIKPSDYPKLHLSKTSYVRTHKQTTMYKSLIDFHKCIGDLKTDYSDCFHEVLDKLDCFNHSVHKEDV